MVFEIYRPSDNGLLGNQEKGSLLASVFFGDKGRRILGPGNGTGEELNRSFFWIRIVFGDLEQEFGYDESTWRRC